MIFIFIFFFISEKSFLLLFKTFINVWKVLVLMKSAVMANRFQTHSFTCFNSFHSFVFLQNGAMEPVNESCPSLNCTINEQILPENRCCNVCKGQ